MGDKTKTLASIDIGTNTFRLLIADVNGNDFKEIYSERVITRIGEGVCESGFLKKEAIQRGIFTLKRFANILSRCHVNRVAAVATGALRDARNSDEFLKMARDEAGIDIEIISGEEEARKTLSGIFISIPAPKSALIVDIGGGSTEFIVSRDTEPLFIESVSLGVVYLNDKYMRHDPPEKEDIELMEAEISQKIKSLVAAIKELFMANTVFIGTAGTITTLAAMAQGLSNFDHRRIHNSRISASSVREIFSDISIISAKERAKYPALEPERFDIIVPGSLILLRIMETLGFKEIIVSDYGLMEGILLELTA